VFLEGLKDKGGGNMAINGFDKALKNQGKRAGKKNGPVSESGPAEAAVGATVPDVSANTDSGTKQEEKETPADGGRTGEEKGEERHESARRALRKAVKDAVRKRKKKIAEALIDKLIDGNKDCAERVFSFIEKKKKGGALSSRHGGLTAADLLGSEEEWESETDEAMEGQSELGMGGREPEGQ
jgi:hypothetical protein